MSFRSSVLSNPERTMPPVIERLLAILLQRPGQVWRTSDLAKHLGHSSAGAVRNYLATIRQRLAPDARMVTIYGKGVVLLLPGMILPPEARSVTPSRRYANGWTDAERQYLRDNAATMTDKQMGAHLGRSEEAVRVYRRQMGLTRNSRHAQVEAHARPSQDGPPRPRGFTDAQTAWARANVRTSMEASMILAVQGIIPGIPRDPAYCRIHQEAAA